MTNQLYSNITEKQSQVIPMIGNKHLQQMNKFLVQDQQNTQTTSQPPPMAYPIKNHQYSAEKSKQSDSNQKTELEQFNQYLQSQTKNVQVQQFQMLKPQTAVFHNNLYFKQKNFTQPETRPPQPLSQPSPEKQQDQSQSQSRMQGISSMIKSSLKIIFMFYSSFGDRQNTTLLKSNKFIKLLCDASIIPKNLSIKEADIIYRQYAKQSLTLQLFQQLLPKLAMRVYPNLKVHQSVLKLFSEHFQDLFEKIMSFTDFGEQISILNNEIGSHFGIVLNPLEKIFQSIHSCVFSDQSDKVSRVQWQYMQFLTQFDLLPTLVSHSQAQLLFSNRKPQGRYLLSLPSFIESLVLISLLHVDKNSENRETAEIESFRMVLERMEQSEGFSIFQKKVSRTQSENMSLVTQADRAILQQNSSQQQSFQQKQINDSLMRKQETKSKLLINEEVSYQIEAYIPQLKSVFEHYAQLGEPLNLVSLKGFKYNKLLQHSKLIPDLISQTDADMIYIKLTGHQYIQNLKNSRLNYDTRVHSPSLENKNKLYVQNEKNGSNGKMSFSQFLKSLELLAAKCFTDLNEDNGITKLLAEFILPLEKSIKTEKQEQVLQILVELLQDEQILQIFAVMQNVFDFYFEHYSQNKTKMDLNGFMKFCLEFELSNCLLSQSHLMHIFNALATLNDQKQGQNLSQSHVSIGSKKQSIYNKCSYIDKHQFVEAISIVAIFVYPHETTKTQRIIYLLDRLSQSEGAIKTQKQFGRTRNPQGYNWDIVGTLNQMFNQDRQENIKDGIDFDDLVQMGLEEEGIQDTLG